MKFPLMALTLLLFMTSCSSKYYQYPYIDKEEFSMGTYKQQSLSSPGDRKFLKGEKEVEKFCAGQILFQKNAYEIAYASINALVAQSCPKQSILIDARITHDWWSALVYSRSCVKVESFCPRI